MGAKVRVDYSDHATERLRERRITRQQVMQCLFDGSLVGFDLRDRKMNQKKIAGRSLVVVYLDADGGGKIVITAYWKGVLP